MKLNEDSDNPEFNPDDRSKAGRVLKGANKLIKKGLSAPIGSSVIDPESGIIPEGSTASLTDRRGNVYYYNYSNGQWFDQASGEPVKDNEVIGLLNNKVRRLDPSAINDFAVNVSDSPYQSSSWQQSSQQPQYTDQVSQQQTQTQPQATANAQAQTPTEPVQNKTSVFTDPTAFSNAWDSYVSSKGNNYQLIADPRMLAVLKDIWQRSGGQQVKETKIADDFPNIKLTESRIKRVFQLSSRVLLEDGNVTIDFNALKQHWEKAGKPTDISSITQLLKSSGVIDSIITQAMTALGIQHSPNHTYKTDNLVYNSAAELQNLYNQFEESNGAISPAVRGKLRDILKTAVQQVK